VDDLRQWLALAVAAALTAVILAGVPSWANPLSDVCLQAAIAAGATIVVLFVTRFLGPPGIAFERVWMAAFLGGMPVVYIVRCLASGGGGSGSVWLWVELAGLPVYAGLAVAGLKRSPWLLAAGVAAHGLAWDSWHYWNTAYIPRWYVIGCLLVDVGLGLYLATRVPVWRNWERQRAGHAGQTAHSRA
jgi:hypothetical protein